MYIYIYVRIDYRFDFDSLIISNIESGRKSSKTYISFDFSYSNADHSLGLLRLSLFRMSRGTAITRVTMQTERLQTEVHYILAIFPHTMLGRYNVDVNPLMPNELVDIFQTMISNPFSWLKIIIFWFKLCKKLPHFQGFQSMIKPTINRIIIVWEWINLIPHLIMDMITCLCWD